MRVIDLSPQDVADGIAADTMMLVDVREPNETAMGRIEGSVLMPLSRFDPRDLPDPQGKRVVFICAAGVRSVTAAHASQMHRLPYDSHLAGGLKAWLAAGGPIER
jgi:rhodanese-related sulfurtransferase